VKNCLDETNVYGNMKEEFAGNLAADLANQSNLALGGRKIN
jgi:hypothetical protein